MRQYLLCGLGWTFSIIFLMPAHVSSSHDAYNLLVTAGTSIQKKKLNKHVQVDKQLILPEGRLCDLNASSP